MTMDLNPFVAQRRDMKLRLLDLIQKHPEMEEKQIVGLFSLQTGLRKARVLEYWQELIDSGVLENGGRNSLKGSSEGNSKASKLADYGSAGNDANNQGNADHGQESAPETAGSKDHGSKREAGKDDN